MIFPCRKVVNIDRISHGIEHAVTNRRRSFAQLVQNGVFQHAAPTGAAATTNISSAADANSSSRYDRHAHVHRSNATQATTISSGETARPARHSTPATSQHRILQQRELRPAITTIRRLRRRATAQTRPPKQSGDRAPQSSGRSPRRALPTTTALRFRPPQDLLTVKPRGPSTVPSTTSPGNDLRRARSTSNCTSPPGRPRRANPEHGPAGTTTAPRDASTVTTCIATRSTG